MNKLSTRLLLIIIILALAAMACIGGGGGDGDDSNHNKGGSNNQTVTHPADATATYGAEQLHIQLTAIAREKK